MGSIVTQGFLWLIVREPATPQSHCIMLNKYFFKKALLTAAVLTYLPSMTLVAASQSQRYTSLKEAIFSEPYEKLPRYKVTTKLFNIKSNTQQSALLDDARRTLAASNDLLGAERGQKLLQANGICFAGEWRIDTPNQFGGVFKEGSSVPVIARASTTFSGTLQAERRSLGLAVKLMPKDLGDAPSLNAFSLHSAGGVTKRYMLDLSMDNEPPLGRIPRLRDVRTALKLKNTLLKADREAGSVEPSATYRSVAALAEHGEELAVMSPRWLRFSPATKHRVDRDDFRDELRVENYPTEEIIYNIEVGHHISQDKSLASWQKIGQLIFNESITSKACDTQLHFAHPKN